MARIFNHRKCNDIVAHLRGVQLTLKAEAEARAVKAEAILRSHYKTGSSQITVTKGKLDRYVNLIDPAALSIEFGSDDGRGNIAPLHRAFGLGDPRGNKGRARRAKRRVARNKRLSNKRRAAR